jgi:L-iditol 2-dehydrogenase
MRAAVLYGPRDLRVQATPTPEPGTGEVLVRVTLAGLCGTDHRIWSGKRAVHYPRVMGHELVGRLTETGERVVIEPNFSCGGCALCREGNRNLCLARTAVGIDVDGGFAELVRVPSRCCWPAPGPVADEDLLLTEPLAVVVRAVARGAPKAGETAAVIGAGTLGLLALQVLRARGARVLVVSRTHRRLELATHLGADATHALADGPLDAAAQRVSGREGVDLVVETAGVAEALGQALELVRPGGRVILTGLPHEPTPLNVFSVVRREVTIAGSMIYQDEFPGALQLVTSGAVRTRPLVTHHFKLDAIGEAFAAHTDEGAIKVALVI